MAIWKWYNFFSLIVFYATLKKYDYPFLVSFLEIKGNDCLGEILNDDEDINSILLSQHKFMIHLLFGLSLRLWGEGMTVKILVKRIGKSQFFSDVIYERTLFKICFCGSFRSHSFACISKNRYFCPEGFRYFVTKANMDWEK